MLFVNHICQEHVLGRHFFPWCFLFACFVVIGYHLAQVNVEIAS